MLRYLLALIPAMTLAQIDLRPLNITATAMFIVSDVNGDGHFTKEELRTNFLTYDENDDGRVSMEEYSGYIEQTSSVLHHLAQSFYAVYDVDKNQYLDKVDYNNFFSLLDSDENGIVEEEEYVKYWVSLLEHPEKLSAQ